MDDIEVELTTLVYGGDALGHLPDGRAVFVPYALPGKRVRVRLTEEKRGHARAELLEVLRPSPQRISPRCVHFGLCGGCHYQHLSYAQQLEYKTAILREQLERIAGIANPPLRAMRPAPSPWNYRNAVQFSLTPAGAGGLSTGWFSHRDSNSRMPPARRCPQPALTALSFEPETGIERVELRLGLDDDLLLVLESEDPQPPEFEVNLPLSAVHLSEAGPVVLAGDDYTVLEVLGRPFRVSAGAFFRSTPPRPRPWWSIYWRFCRCSRPSLC